MSRGESRKGRVGSVELALAGSDWPAELWLVGRKRGRKKIDAPVPPETSQAVLVSSKILHAFAILYAFAILHAFATPCTSLLTSDSFSMMRSQCLHKSEEVGSFARAAARLSEH